MRARCSTPSMPMRICWAIPRRGPQRCSSRCPTPRGASANFPVLSRPPITCTWLRRPAAHRRRGQLRPGRPPPGPAQRRALPALRAQRRAARRAARRPPRWCWAAHTPPTPGSVRCRRRCCAACAKRWRLHEPARPPEGRVPQCAARRYTDQRGRRPPVGCGSWRWNATARCSAAAGAQRELRRLSDKLFDARSSSDDFELHMAAAAQCATPATRLSLALQRAAGPRRRTRGCAALPPAATTQ